MTTPDSDVLILTICSFRKRVDGTPAYDDRAAVAPRLKGDHRDRLLERRRDVLRWLRRQTELRWHGQTLRDIEYNKNLALGRDFGETGAGSAKYPPAIHRYRGRLYKELGADGRRKALRTRHHVLIISGLYGLVTPGEFIQCYSCPVDVHWASFNKWTRTTPTLTDMLLGYVERQGISKVVDLTANRTYRQLLDWRRVRAALNGDPSAVLHCFSKTAVGDDALPVFGRLLREDLLEPEDEAVRTISASTTKPFGNEEIAFMARPVPPPGWPREVAPRVRDLDDEADRARRGVLRFLDEMEGSRHVPLTREEADSARDIKRIRNDVVYRRQDVEGPLLANLRRAAEHLRGRAAQRRLDIPELDTDWDQVLGR